MNISTKSLMQLQQLLREQVDREYTHEELQAAGLSVMRFVLCKEFIAAQTINDTEKKNE